ncbi:LysR family transcriptional regulator [Pseudoroseicyclus sp. H15]
MHEIRGEGGMTGANGKEGQGNWNDLRYVLAVAETGSVTAAARRMGVNHATVLRRVNAFEAALGTLIFRREAAGYAVLPEQLHVIERAREAAQAFDAVARAARGGEGGEGVVPLRVTSTDSFCQGVLPEILAELSREGMAIDLFAANHHVDLGRLAADLTVRPAMRLPDDLFGVQAGTLGFAAYAAPGGADCWLGLRGALARAVPAAWLEEQTGGAPVRGGADSFLVLARMAAAGMGSAILPCIVGDAAPELRRLPHDLSQVSVPIWVASHADLAEAPRLETVKSRLVRALKSRGAELSGWAAPAAEVQALRTGR